MTETLNQTRAGIGTAIRNANEAAALVNIAAGALDRACETLRNMRAVAMKSFDISYKTADRVHFNNEWGRSRVQLMQILGSARHQGQFIFGADAGERQFIIGIDTDITETLVLFTRDLQRDPDVTKLANGDITTPANAQIMLTYIDAALRVVMAESERFNLVSGQSRFWLSLQAIEDMRMTSL